jgi:hypothetical protein
MKKESKPIKGQKPTEDDLFYLDWGRESIKNNLKNTNDILKQLITISTAVLGLTIVFENIIKHDSLRIVVLFLFFLSLIISFLGILPYGKKIQINSAEEIKEFKSKALKTKRLYIWFSGGMILSGFAVIIISMAFQLLSN